MKNIKNKSRPTQLQGLKVVADKVNAKIKNVIKTVLAQKMNDYECALDGISSEMFECRVPGTEQVKARTIVSLKAKLHEPCAVIVYEIVARGAEAVVCRGLFSLYNKDQSLELNVPWEEIFWYPGEEYPDNFEVLPDLNNCLIQALEFLETNI